MKHISNVTLVAVATTDVEATAKALQFSIRDLSFDRVLLISSYNPFPETESYEQIDIQPFNSVGEWGEFVVFELHRHIHTDHIILIHADGFIVNPESWSDEFLEYDFIGAPWPLPKDDFSYRDHFGNIIRVGNSVSLRSLKLLRLPSEIGLDWATADHGFFHEDGFLCVQNRHILQYYGINYAPLSVACQFSRERSIQENKEINPFAFHKWDGANRHYPRFTAKSTFGYQIRKTLNKVKQKLVICLK